MAVGVGVCFTRHGGLGVGRGGGGVCVCWQSLGTISVRTVVGGGYTSCYAWGLPSVGIWYSRWGFSTGLWAWLWFSVGGGGCTLVAHSPFWGAVAGAVRLPLVGVYPDGFFVGVSTVGG